MNETQKQILADRIDSLTRHVEDQREAVANLETRLAKRKAELATNEKLLAELSEGAPW